MKIKINKKLVLFTSILILLPSLVGCVFWNQLPEEIPTHFNLLGQADGYNHKMFAIFGITYSHAFDCIGCFYFYDLRILNLAISVQKYKF